MEPALPDTLRKSDLPAFFRAIGLPMYARRAEQDASEELEELAKKLERTAVPAPIVRKFLPPAPPPPPPPTPEPKWLFLSVPEEAITHRIRGRAMLALPGELDGFGTWLPRWKFKRLGDGLVLPAKVDHEYTAEKAEKVGKKWKVVASKQLTRAAMAKLFPPVAATWDDLGAYDEPDDPKWNHEAWVKTHVPEPLEREEREICDELLMGSEEASWQEADA